MLYTDKRMFNFLKVKQDIKLEEIGQYINDLDEMSNLRDNATGTEKERYDYIIEVMQRTLTELIDRNKE